MKERIVEHSFSVEMKSKEYIKQISFSANENNCVLLEGFLGKLEKVSMVEDLMVEIKGSNGILRIDLKKDEIKHLFTEKNPH